MLECRYASSIYYNQENGYTVAVYETEEKIPEGKNGIGKRQFVAVGCELPRNEGIDISLKRTVERIGEVRKTVSCNFFPNSNANDRGRGKSVSFFRTDERDWTGYCRAGCRTVWEKYFLCF